MGAKGVVNIEKEVQMSRKYPFKRYWDYNRIFRGKICTRFSTYNDSKYCF